MTLLQPDLLREAGCALLEQRRIVVGLPAEPVILVLAVRLRAEIPLLRRRGQQRSVRRPNPQHDIRHSSQLPTPNCQLPTTTNAQLPTTTTNHQTQLLTTNHQPPTTNHQLSLRSPT